MRNKFPKSCQLLLTSSKRRWICQSTWARSRVPSLAASIKKILSRYSRLMAWLAVTNSEMPLSASGKCQRSPHKKSFRKRCQLLHPRSVSEPVSGNRARRRELTTSSSYSWKVLIELSHQLHPRQYQSYSKCQNSSQCIPAAKAAALSLGPRKRRRPSLCSNLRPTDSLITIKAMNGKPYLSLKFQLINQ